MTEPSPQTGVRNRPRPLGPGACTTIIAPSGPLKNREALVAGAARLRAAGLVVREPYLPPATPVVHAYLAASDLIRLTALNEALRDPDADAIFCLRGGYGALRLLDGIDYEAAARHPKLVVGYSDITALHLALYTRSGLPGLSGPMVAVDWGDIDPQSEAQFWSLVRGEAPALLTNTDGTSLQPLLPGDATGVLLGGNFSVFCRLIGTPYMPDLQGALLFLEDVNESAYRIDGMLAQCKMAGLLDQLGGIVLGGFTDSDDPQEAIEAVFAEYARPLGIPVARGLAYGHFPIKSAVPVGVKARLTVDSSSAFLHLLESVVA